MEENEKITGIVFYENWYSPMQECDEKTQLDFYNAVFQYAFYGIEPQIKGEAKRAFILIKPNIDNNINSYINGKKGGRPPKKKGVTENQKGGLLEIQKGGYENSKTESKVIESKIIENKVNETKVKESIKKNKYGEFGHVRLTDDEYQRLVADYPYHEELIKILDEYCETSGKSYKNYNLVLRGWVLDNYNKKHKKEVSIF